ncbi:thioesterase family protein [Leekyejoonella antrihumi]|uniref:thioesterase family protein n=1 Tax=Leekyejoonella antrihumi TaxID=1660198 RepID=UPI001FE7F2CF|nr:thioesterase family protein [Leekyejoonella antrihumi]
MTTPTILDPDSNSYYRPLGNGRYLPTLHVQGAWNDHEQHMSPVGGLIAHELMRHEPRADMQLARINFEILGLIPAQDTHISVTTIRPGRTIELLEATLTIGERVIVRARAWRLSRQDTSAVAAVELPSMPPPDECTAYNPTQEWPGAFLASLRMKAVPGGRAGRRSVWVQSTKTLVEGVDVDPLASYAMLIDTANGIATRVRPHEMMYPNVELSVHLFRNPDAQWVGLDTCVTFGESGIGLTSTTLGDIHGPVGRSEQCLTVRDLPTG